MKTIILPVPSVLVLPGIALCVLVALFFLVRAFVRGDDEAKARYLRELRRVGLWVAGFAALMAVLIGLR